MGRPMATNLVKAGHDVTVWNRTPKSVEGARMAATPAEAAKDAEIVWMCVADTKAVETVLFGPVGVETVLRTGIMVIDSSTIAPMATRDFAARVRAKGGVCGRSCDGIEDRRGKRPIAVHCRRSGKNGCGA